MIYIYTLYYIHSPRGTSMEAGSSSLGWSLSVPGPLRPRLGLLWSPAATFKHPRGALVDDSDPSTPTCDILWWVYINGKSPLLIGKSTVNGNFSSYICIYNWLVVSNMAIKFSHSIWDVIPLTNSYSSRWLKPPTRYVVKTVEIHYPFGNGLYHLSMGIWRMVYHCFSHIIAFKPLIVGDDLWFWISHPVEVL